MNDFFQAVGKQPSSINLLKIADRGPERFSEQCLRIQVSIPSGPGIGKFFIDIRFFRTVSAAYTKCEYLMTEIYHKDMKLNFLMIY